MAASVALHEDFHSRSAESGDAAAYSVELIDSKDHFLSLKRSWESLYAGDPETGFFMSWGWISSVFHRFPGRLRILAVRGSGRGSDYVAFFPVASRIRWSASKQEFQGVLEAGGRPGLSEQTGFLCDPAHEQGAIAAIATAVCALPWTRFSMRYEPTGRRSEIFLSWLPETGFRGQFDEWLINDGTVDNLANPQVKLAASFDDYLAGLSSSTRQKVRRFTRRHMESGLWHVSQASGSNAERHIEILLELWNKQWGAQRRSSQARKTVSIYRHMLQTAHQMGALHLPILWQDDTPLVAHGCIRDMDRSHVYFVLSGRNMQLEHHNSGMLLHCDSISRAIDEGMSIYDFGHGDESYKLSLGGICQRLHYVTINRLSDDLAQTVDTFNMTDPARKIRHFIDKQDLQLARRACNQMLEILEASQTRTGPALATINDPEA